MLYEVRSEITVENSCHRFATDNFRNDFSLKSSSLLTFRSRHNTSLVLQLDISSRASLRDNFLNIAPRVHAIVMATKKKDVARVHRPVASASGFCGRGVLTALAASYFPPFPPHPVLLTSIDDYLVCWWRTGHHQLRLVAFLWYTCSLRHDLVSVVLNSRSRLLFLQLAIVLSFLENSWKLWKESLVSYI